VYANDIDAKKRAIYDARFDGFDHFHLEDVRNTAEVVARITTRPFLATASFPCIDLSLAGHWRGLQGEHSSTFFGFTHVLEQLGGLVPRAVLLENVTGLLTSHAGEDFRTLVTSLSLHGYWLDAFVLDAKAFVPQSRPRVFILGIDEELNRLCLAKRAGLFGDAWETGLAPSPVRPQSLVALIRSIALPTGWLGLAIKPPARRRIGLESVIDLDAGQEWWDQAAVEKHYNMMSDRHRENVNRLLDGGGVHVGTIYRRKRHGKTRSEVRFDGVAGCLRTPRGGSGRQIVIVVDSGKLRMRWMSPREYARLQGAADYPILKNVNQMLFGFGDAVCVPVIRWIDRQVLTPLFDCARTRQTTESRRASVVG
jgi:DNA (cytosine-5)-methyltransferase 1